MPTLTTVTPRSILWLALPLCLGIGLLQQGSAREATKDACSLLAASEARIALGEPVGPAQVQERSFGPADGSSCRYRPTASRPPGATSVLLAKSVSLTVRYSETDLTGSATGIAENLKSAGFSNVHAVSGIGSSAVWGSNSVLGKSQGELTVIKGKSVMLIVILNGIPDETESLSRARVIAARAITRL